MAIKIKQKMQFERDQSMRKLAERVVNAYPELFDHIDLDCVEFLRETTAEPCNAAGMCQRIGKVTRDMLNCHGLEIEWIIVFFDCHAEGKSDEWLQILMFHELLHIGPRGGLVEHDIEDFKIVLGLAGVNWTDDRNLPDIIRKKIHLVA
jgi:predicted metallopeptidase